MRASVKGLVISLLITLLVVGAIQSVSAQQPSANVKKGKTLFERVCVTCHGRNGTGDGPAAFFMGSYSSPRPSDLTAGTYKFRSTPSGELPTDQDLFQTLTKGIPGFMPPFTGLTAEDRWHVVAYVKTLYSGFKEAEEEEGEEVQPVLVGFPKVPSTAESIQLGRAIYFQFECDSCHGPNGRGNSALFHAGELKDSRDLPIRPADLTNFPSFKNGSSTRAIARSILTGMDGTPMPSFADTFTDPQKDVWHLVNFIRSLAASS